MLRNIFSLILCQVFLLDLSAQSIYLKMDAKCMDRMEYNAGNATNPYVSYSFKLGDKKFASFDVGYEAPSLVQQLPGKLTACSAIKVDRDFVSNVNAGKIKLYIVRENSNNYHIAPVDKGTLISTQGNTMDFATEDVEFSLQLNNPISGVNLALPGSKSQIYLDGTISYQCMKGYIFQKKENADSRTFKEYVVVPELGIVERASVSKAGFADEMLRDNEFKLSKIGTNDFRSVLSNACDRVQAAFYDGGVVTTFDVPKSYDTTTPKGATTTTRPVSYGSEPCAPTAEPGVHVVQKGETLFAISRRYGVSVAQLQTWNNLANTNVINQCQKLKVSGSASFTNTSTTGTTTTGTSPTQTEKGNTTATSGTGYWMQSAGDHQVRSGETVASVAKMYGYTEERFRKMNGLSPTESVLPGQRLRTSDCNCPTLASSTEGTPLPYDEISGPITSTNKDGGTGATPDDVYYRPISVYVVASDDTMYSISKQFNTTIERVMELNGLTKNDKLTPGMKIYVQ